MNQQVNLLTDDLRRKREALTFPQLLMVWGVFGGLLVLATGWDGAGIWRLSTEQARTIEQYQMLRRVNEQLKGKYLVGPDAELIAEVEALRALQAEQQQLMSLLLGYQSDRDGGFSSYLNDIVTHHVDGMWLSRIALDDGGTRIQLEGVTTDAVYVPVFLKRLGSGSSFEGHRFDEFELKESEDGLLEFAITGPNKGAAG